MQMLVSWCFLQVIFKNGCWSLPYLSYQYCTSAEPAAAKDGAKAAAKTPTPATFPKVDDNAQKARDNDRRRILEGELATEQASLEQARKDLVQQEANPQPEERVKGGAFNGAKVEERLQPYKDKVALHERNIEAIQKELAKLR